MRIAHDAVVVVADGEKMLFLRNEGDAEHLHLIVEREQSQDNPPDREQSSDRPGRSFSSNGARRSAVQETDFHRLAEDRFAAETAAFLRKRALANGFDQLVVVAPPNTLGELRKKYHVEVTERLTAELAKDLTNHPVEEIERILVAA